MGVINHNVVIATSCFEDKIKAIIQWILSLKKDGKDLFIISPTRTNAYVTIICGPDGSKEGWEESNTVNELRDDFVERLEQDVADDGGSYWNWVEVGFGEFGQKVLRGNNKNCYGDSDYQEG